MSKKTLDAKIESGEAVLIGTRDGVSFYRVTLNESFTVNGVERQPVVIVEVK